MSSQSIEAFGERFDLTSGIKSILDSYTWGNAILRESLQNSDDAQATQQIFILDRRQHGTSTLIDPNLARCQGPALLSVNDTVFSDADWKAIRTIHGSSKVQDQAQTGKFGIGFRSNYHITDNPHILSGSHLVVFDPHERCDNLPGGGVRVHLQEFPSYPDQLDAFSSYIEDFDVPFEGTIVRLPLRTHSDAMESKIKNTETTPDEISRLFKQFVEQELSETLLFLRHVAYIEFREVDTTGVTRIIAKVSIEDADETASLRSFSRDQTLSLPHYTLNVIVEDSNGIEQQSAWRILHFVENNERAANLVQQRHGKAVREALLRDKLFPHVALAAPLSSLDIEGRLFTLLPLPIFSGLPFHLHGILALTPDRQHLRKKDPALMKGSRDQLLVHWNEVLFECFVPQAWAEMLDVLVRVDGVDNIFAFWPSVGTQEGSSYWTGLARGVLKEVVARGFAVWPTVDGSGEITYHKLEEVLVVPDSMHHDAGIIGILRAVGLPILLIPRRLQALHELLSDVPVQVTLLNPWSASNRLQNCLQKIESLQASSKAILLEFLLSTKQLSCVRNIPIIPLVSGAHARLANRSARKSHLLADKDISRLFSIEDPDMVNLDVMATSCRSVFEDPSAVHSTNIHTITVDIMNQYVSDKLSSFRSGRPEEVDSHGLADWLVQFWIWIMQQHQSWITEMLVQLSSLHLLPTSRGTLRQLSLGGVDSHTFSSTDRNVLDLLGVPILSEKLPKLPKISLSVDDLNFIVRNTIVRFFSDAERQLIQRFVIRKLASGSLITPTTRLALYKLPIFPLLPPGLSNGHVLSKLESGPQLLFCDGPQVLPIVHNTIYFDGQDDSGRILARAIQPNFLVSSKEAVFHLGLKYFEEQTPPIREELVRQILGYLLSLRVVPSELLERLRNTRFIRVGDGTLLRSPAEVVDPEAPVASIYPLHHPRVPYAISEQTRRTLSMLHNLGLLLRDINAQLLAERIQELCDGSDGQQAARHDEALKLLRYLDNRPDSAVYDPNTMQKRWLPAITHTGQKHLCFPTGCWDEPEICDLVLLVVPVRIKNAAVRGAMGWSVRLPFMFFRTQFWAITNRTDTTADLPLRLSKVIQYGSLGLKHGSYTEDDLSSLTQVIASDKAWVPASSGEVVRPKYAILELTLDPRLPFRSVSPSLISDAQRFLLLMGCRPTVDQDMLFEHLTTRPSTEVALAILEKLKKIPSEQRSSAWIPDFNGHLRGFKEIFFNDRDSSHTFSYTGTIHYAAHPGISRQLALRLELRTLSDLRSVVLDAEEEDDDEEDFSQEEDFTTRINGVLRDYDIDYSFNEFVANADDAGASKITFILDEQEYPSRNLLSPQLALFHKVPSLIVHNDAVFSESDLRGISTVGRGSKTDQLNKIGRMGLGALSMYHFTEVPLLLSGDHLVLFDPSRENLPRNKQGRRRGGMKSLIGKLNIEYPDQLSPFWDTLGFSKDADHYEGTIFRFPLRSQNLTTRSKLSQVPFLARDMVDRLRRFYELAHTSLFFTASLKCIEVQRRSPSGILSRMWEVKLDKNEPLSTTCGTEGRMMSLSLLSPISVQTRESWLVVESEVSLPERYTPLITSHRVSKSRTVEVGLATLLPSQRHLASSDAATTSRLLATLPLPVEIDLPLHVHASFVLERNRRDVTLAPETALEASYNRWILEELVPSLYLRAAEGILSLSPTKFRTSTWWPSSPKSRTAQVILDALYTQTLETTSYRVCRSVTEELIRPMDAIFPDIHDTHLTKFIRELDITSFVAVFPFPRRAGMPDFRQASPSVVRELIDSVRMQKVPDVVASLNDDELNAVITFFARSPEALFGLPIIPLCDGTFTSVTGIEDAPLFVTSPELAKGFGESHFIQGSRLASDTVDCLTRNLEHNFRHLDAAGVRHLLGHYQIVPNAIAWHSIDTMRWLHDQFWPMFLRLPIASIADLYDLPIFPTLNGYFISYNTSKESALTHQASRDDTEELNRSLIEIGATIVQRYHSNINHALPIMYLTPSMVLRAIKGKVHSIEGDEPFWGPIAAWIHEQLLAGLLAISSEDLSILYELPLWKAYHRSGRSGLVSAGSTLMLPSGVPAEVVVRFLKRSERYTNYSSVLSSIVRQRFSQSSPITIAGHFDFPSQLNEDDLRFLKQLVELPRRAWSIPLLPDGDRYMKSPSQLFDHNVALFNTVFGTPSRERGSFVHPMLRDAHGLESLGIQTSISFSTLLQCAKAIHQDSGIEDAGLIDRATAVFEELNQYLAQNALHSSQWRELIYLDFIPRSLTPSQERFAPPLPSIVSLDDMILSRKEGHYLWTQKAHFAIRPSQEVINNVRAICAISPETVVKHLVVLSELGRTFAPNDPNGPGRDLMRESLIATYAWLSDHHEAARISLLQNGDVPLFLNVDDIENAHESWEGKWQPAKSLILNLTYDQPGSGQFYVRDCLSQYKPLLLAAGVETVVDTDFSPAVNAKADLRQAANSLRKSGLHMDLLLSTEGAEGDAKKISYPVHSFFLCMVIPHFSNIWESPGPLSHVETSALPLLHLPKISDFVLRNTIEFAYTEQIEALQVHDATEMGEALQSLLDLLTHADYWDMSELLSLTTTAIVRTYKLVQPETVGWILEVATKANAAELASYCERYTEDNAALLRNIE